MNPSVRLFQLMVAGVAVAVLASIVLLIVEVAS